LPKELRVNSLSGAVSKEREAHWRKLFLEVAPASSKKNPERKKHMKKWTSPPPIRLRNTFNRYENCFSSKKPALDNSRRTLGVALVALMRGTGAAVFCYSV
jgi:hypothetical protein